MAELALGERSGLVPDLAGPKIYTAAVLVKSYLRAAGKRLAPVHSRPGRQGDPDRGEPAPDRAVGKRTWEEFLARPHPAHQLATAMKRQTGISVSHRDLRLR